jgi:hypothetical protein
MKNIDKIFRKDKKSSKISKTKIPEILKKGPKNISKIME